MTFKSSKEMQRQIIYLFGAVLALLLALRQADLRHFPRPSPVYRSDTVMIGLT